MAPRSFRPPRLAPPRRRPRRVDDLLGIASATSAWVPGLVVLFAGVVATTLAWPSLRAAPLGVLWGDVWDPAAGRFGAWPMFVGTAVTTSVALLLAAPVALGAALYLAELAPVQARRGLDVLLDLVSAVPSVVWGLFALDVVLPVVDRTFRRMGSGGDVAPGGFSLLSGGIVLAAMLVPTIASASREVLRAVPTAYREAAIALGATRWEVVRIAVLPSAWGGLLGALLLGVGRALGEATVMAMILGARLDAPRGLASPGYSVAALLLDQVGEATAVAHLAALAHVTLALLVVSIGVHVAARLLVDRAVEPRSARVTT